MFSVSHTCSPGRKPKPASMTHNGTSRGKPSLVASLAAMTEAAELPGHDNKYSKLYTESGFLGRGEHGTVWQAEHTMDGRSYAVKKVRLQVERNARIQKENEATLAAVARFTELDTHANVATPAATWLEDLGYDGSVEAATGAGTAGDQSMTGTLGALQALADSDAAVGLQSYRFTHLFTATPLGTDGTLAGWLAARGCVSRRDNLTLLVQLARGTMHLHAAGLVHGCLKPTNVLAETPSEDGTRTWRVCDFALGAVAAAADGQAAADGGSSNGTPYAAPEQAAEGAEEVPVGEAADVYALGLVFYELFLSQPSEADRVAAFSPLRYDNTPTTHALYRRVHEHTPQSFFPR